MKLIVCDCCGKPIGDGLLKRYRYVVRRYALSLWSLDQSLDLCEDCYERIKAECEKDYFYREEK